MKFAGPIPLEFLPHTVTLYKSKIITPNTEGIVLEHVRLQINPPFFTDRGAFQQNGIGNYKLYYDMTNSTPLPAGVKFAISDTIKFDQFPNVAKIIKIEPIWGEDNQIHHYELGLD